MTVDRIHVEDLRVDAIIGILPAERLTPQPVILSVELSLDATIAALSGSLLHSLDYARISTEIAFIIRAARFRLVETAALALVHYLLNPLRDLQVSKARVTIRKPNALTSGVPGVTIERSSEQIVVTKDVVNGGTLARIFAGKDVNLWLLEGTPQVSEEAAAFKVSEDLRLETTGAGLLLRVLTNQ